MLGMTILPIHNKAQLVIYSYFIPFKQCPENKTKTKYKNYINYSENYNLLHAKGKNILIYLITFNPVPRTTTSYSSSIIGRNSIS